MFEELPSAVRDTLTHEIWRVLVCCLERVAQTQTLVLRLQTDARPLPARITEGRQALKRWRTTWEQVLQDAEARAVKAYREACEGKRGKRSETVALRSAVHAIRETPLPTGSGRYDRGTDRAKLARQLKHLTKELEKKRPGTQADVDILLQRVCPGSPHVSYDDEVRLELEKGLATAAAYLLSLATPGTYVKHRDEKTLQKLLRKYKREGRTTKLDETRRIKALLGRGNPPPLVKPATKRKRSRLLPR